MAASCKLQVSGEDWGLEEPPFAPWIKRKGLLPQEDPALVQLQREWRWGPGLRCEPRRAATRKRNGREPHNINKRLRAEAFFRLSPRSMAAASASKGLADLLAPFANAITYHVHGSLGRAARISLVSGLWWCTLAWLLLLHRRLIGRRPRCFSGPQATSRGLQATLLSMQPTSACWAAAAWCVARVIRHLALHHNPSSHVLPLPLPRLARTAPSTAQPVLSFASSVCVSLRWGAAFAAPQV